MSKVKRMYPVQMEYNDERPTSDPCVLGAWGLSFRKCFLHRQADVSQNFGHKHCGWGGHCPVLTSTHLIHKVIPAD